MKQPQNGLYPISRDRKFGIHIHSLHSLHGRTELVNFVVGPDWHFGVPRNCVADEQMISRCFRVALPLISFPPKTTSRMDAIWTDWTSQVQQVDYICITNTSLQQHRIKINNHERRSSPSLLFLSRVDALRRTLFVGLGIAWQVCSIWAAMSYYERA